MSHEYPDDSRCGATYLEEQRPSTDIPQAAPPAEYAGPTSQSMSPFKRKLLAIQGGYYHPNLGPATPERTPTGRMDEISVAIRRREQVARERQKRIATGLETPRAPGSYIDDQPNAAYITLPPGWLEKLEGLQLDRKGDGEGKGRYTNRLVHEIMLKDSTIRRLVEQTPERMTIPQKIALTLLRFENRRMRGDRIVYTLEKQFRNDVKAFLDKQRKAYNKYFLPVEPILAEDIFKEHDWHLPSGWEDRIFIDLYSDELVGYWEAPPFLEPANPDAQLSKLPDELRVKIFSHIIVALKPIFVRYNKGALPNSSLGEKWEYTVGAPGWMWVAQIHGRPPTSEFDCPQRQDRVALVNVFPAHSRLIYDVFFSGNTFILLNEGSCASQPFIQGAWLDMIGAENRRCLSSVIFILRTAMHESSATRVEDALLKIFESPRMKSFAFGVSEAGLTKREIEDVTQIRGVQVLERCRGLKQATIKGLYSGARFEQRVETLQQRLGTLMKQPKLDINGGPSYHEKHVERDRAWATGSLYREYTRPQLEGLAKLRGGHPHLFNDKSTLALAQYVAELERQKFGDPYPQPAQLQ